MCDVGSPHLYLLYYLRYSIDIEHAEARFWSAMSVIFADGDLLHRRQRKLVPLPIPLARSLHMIPVHRLTKQDN